METKLGKNRTEAEVKRFTEEKERLEKEKEEIRAQLTQLRKERRELKEMLGGSTGRAGQGGVCGNEPRWGRGERGHNEPGPPRTRRDEGNGVLCTNHITQIALEQEPESLLGQNTRKKYRTCPDPSSPAPSRHQDSSPLTDKSLEQRLKEIDEECKRKESQRVDLELSLVEVKENLKKAESGPVTLGTAVDTTHLENTAPRVCGAPLGCTAAFWQLGSHTVSACLKM